MAIGGARVDRSPPKERDVAMVFQSYALYPYMTVAENIALPLVMRRMNAWQRLPLVGRLLPGTRARRRRDRGRDVGAVAAHARHLAAARSASRRNCRAASASASRSAARWCAIRRPS